MKLIIAIVKDEDNDAVSTGLTELGFRVTFIASTGGFCVADVVRFSSAWRTTKSRPHCLSYEKIV